MKGFKFSGICAGIKKKQIKDLGIIWSDRPCTAAALFTRNKVVAAPVLLGKERLRYGRCQAVLVNSGNANCFTGTQGLEDARACSRIAAQALDIDEDLVFVSSTGVIGAPLVMDRFEEGVPKAVQQLSETGLDDFARAILTTDTCTKIVTRTVQNDSGRYTLTGVAKGSGMIRPDMATMLAYVCTDVSVSAEQLKQALTEANEASFNRITVDGDTSTNDTLLALANTASGVKLKSAAEFEEFSTALKAVCVDLAKTIVMDGEGATKLCEIRVTGAQSPEDAYRVCDAIAHSNLVKTAIYGEDPNWGRITAAAGRSGAHVDPDKMDLYFESEPLVLQGVWLGPEAELKTAQIMKNKTINIRLDLNLGSFSDRYFFCDFSENYVKINADYRT